MSTTCLDKRRCYPYVLHSNQLPDKDVLAKALVEREAKKTSTSSTAKQSTHHSDEAATAGNELQPCAGCKQLVNGDCKCEGCHQNMHVFCSVFPTEDGNGTIMCPSCNEASSAAVENPTRKRRSDKGKFFLFIISYYYYYFS